MTFEKYYSKFLWLLLLVIFRMLLDYYYQVFSDVFDYYGMIWNPRSYWEILLSYLLLVVIGAFIPFKGNRASNLILILLFLFCYVPAGTLFSYNQHHLAFAFLGLSMVFLSLPIILKINFLKCEFKTQYFKLSAFKVLIFSVTIVSVCSIICAFGFSFQSEGLSDIYNLRADYKSATNRFLTYLFSWQTHIISSAIVLVAIIRRQLILLFIAILLELYFFTVGGHKSVLLLIPFLFWIIFGLKYWKNNFALYALGTLLMMMGTLFLFDIQQGEFSMVSSIFIRRNLLMPAQLFFNYADFFSHNSYDYFAQSFPFELFYDSNYAIDIPEIIGDKYLIEGRNIHANGNIFADLFANIGLWAFPFSIAFFAILLKLMNAVSLHRNLLFTHTLLATSVISLMNSGFIVNLITHGLLLSILLVALFPKTKFVFRDKKSHANHRISAS